MRDLLDTAPSDDDEPAPIAYGDSAYGAGEVLHQLDAAGIQTRLKVQAPVAPGGQFTKDQFAIGLDAGTVTCPSQVTVPIRRVSYPRFRGVLVTWNRPAPGWCRTGPADRC